MQGETGKLLEQIQSRKEEVRAFLEGAVVEDPAQKEDIRHAPLSPLSQA